MEAIFLGSILIILFSIVLSLSISQDKENLKSKLEKFNNINIDDMHRSFLFDMARYFKIDTNLSVQEIEKQLLIKQK